MARQPIGQGHDGQRGVRERSGRKHRRPRKVEIVTLKETTVWIDNTELLVVGHPGRPHVMTAITNRRIRLDIFLQRRFREAKPTPSFELRLPAYGFPITRIVRASVSFNCQ